MGQGDLPAARKYFELAVRKGSAVAVFNLGNVRPPPIAGERTRGTAPAPTTSKHCSGLGGALCLEVT